MDQQLRIGDFSPRSSSIDSSSDNQSSVNGEDGSAIDVDLHYEVNSEVSDAATLEQRRAYKKELQVKQ